MPFSGGAGEPRAHDGWHLGDAVTGQGGADHQLGRLVLRLGLRHVAEQLWCHDPQAGGGVGYGHPGQHPGQTREGPHPERAERIGVMGFAEGPRPDHEVRFAGGHHLDHRRQVTGIPLSVGVQGGDIASPVLPCGPVAGSQRDPMTTVAAQPQHRGSVLAGDLAGGVVGAVIDDQHVEGQAGGGGGISSRTSGRLPASLRAAITTTRSAKDRSPTSASKARRAAATVSAACSGSLNPRVIFKQETPEVDVPRAAGNRFRSGSSWTRPS